MDLDLDRTHDVAHSAPGAPSASSARATQSVEPRAAIAPQATTLSGTSVTLVPLSVEQHAPDLYEAASGSAGESLWQYLLDGPFASYEDYAGSLRKKLMDGSLIQFAILDGPSRRAIGSAAYLRIDAGNGSIEVGSLLFTAALQRTRGATEAMYLMARHAFEELGYRRYEWRCNSQNRPSHQAALRLGFTYEGTFRQHMISKGKNRDTDWFSTLDLEWPARKQRLERWLAAENFDPSGKQRVALSEMPL